LEKGQKRTGKKKKAVNNSFVLNSWNFVTSFLQRPVSLCYL